MILYGLLCSATLVGAPKVTWKAPAAYVAGSPFVIEMEITAGEGGASVPEWLLSAAAFKAGGRRCAEPISPQAIDLPAGFKISGSFDVSAAIPAKADFELSIHEDFAAGSSALKVKYLEGAPSGLDFMTLPVEELASYQVVLVTSHGLMRLELWPDIAPNHARNYLDLAYTGFYDGSKFHRCMQGFMIQGGDPNTKQADPNTWGSGQGPRQLKAEFNPRKHERGVLSMARGPNPDSASCQFFVCHAAAGSLDNQYTAFGKLLEGFEVLDKIATAPGSAIPAQSGGGVRPNPPISIVKAAVIKGATLGGKQ